MKRNSSRTNPKRSLGGFTLVELIVVIAVLAILAGVGAVAYNGYIEYTQKGVDRTLVGELMHAVELADYADPTLFGDSNYAIITISEDGITAGGTSDSDKFKASLEDALSLDQTLTYKKWSGVDGSAIKDGTFAKYQSWQNDFQTTPASFAGDMEHYWDVFTDMVNGIRDGTLINDDNVTLSLVKGHESQFTNDVIQKYNDNILSNSDTVESIITAWQNLDSFGNLGYRIDLQLARNYSFVSFAKKQQLTADMQKELEAYEQALENINNINDFNNVETFKDSKWKDVIDAYKGTQGKSDAEAYLSLMEAAGQVSNQLKGGDSTKVLDDETLLGAISEHVGMVGGLISGKIDFDTMKSLVEGLDGNDVRIDITKEDGVLSFNVTPEDASPRENAKRIKYSNSLRISYTARGGFGKESYTINMRAGETCEVSVVTNNNQAMKTATIGEPSGAEISIDQSSYDSTGKITITANSATSGPVSFTLTYTSRTETFSTTVYINVYEK